MSATSNTKPLTVGTTVLVALAAFSSGMAFIVPMTFTLAHRIGYLYPGRDYRLGWVLAGAALISVLIGPVVGLFSDRHRSRFGRRRPFMLGAALVGLAGLPFIVTAQSANALMLGWLITSAGWGTAMITVMFTVADIAPPHQRGRLTGFAGMGTQLSPVVGVPLVGLFSDNHLMMFAITSLVGLIGLFIFCWRLQEADSRSLPDAPPLSMRIIISSFVFNPLRHRGFAYAWLGRFCFFFALGMASTFQTFFYAQRLGLSLTDIVPILTLISALSALPTIFGAVLMGRISDRVGRGPINIFSALSYALGSAILAFAHNLPLLIVGALFTALGFATFMAVGEATVLDVLPDPKQPGRYLAINQFAQRAPSAIAPMMAPVLMALGSGNYANYTAMMLGAGLCGLLGGLAMRRASSFAKPITH